MTIDLIISIVLATVAIAILALAMTLLVAERVREEQQRTDTLLDELGEP